MADRGSSEDVDCCSIYFEERMEDMSVIPQNGHLFCQKCIKKWVEVKAHSTGGDGGARSEPIVSCPNCREDMEKFYYDLASEQDYETFYINPPRQSATECKIEEEFPWICIGRHYCRKEDVYETEAMLH